MQKRGCCLYSLYRDLNLHKQELRLWSSKVADALENNDARLYKYIEFQAVYLQLVTSLEHQIQTVRRERKHLFLFPYLRSTENTVVTAKKYSFPFLSLSEGLSNSKFFQQQHEKTE
jgi:hypothetical protein